MHSTTSAAMAAFRARSSIVVTLVILGAIPWSGQQKVDRSKDAPPTLAFNVSSACTVFGDGMRGRPEGLLEVSGGMFAADSSVVVLNAGTSELLVFARDGQFVQARGRAGEGPGEFSARTGRIARRLRMVEYRADSIAVYDAPAMRISVFDSKGRFGRSFEVRGEPLARRAYLEGTATDGDFVLVATGGFTQAQPRSGNIVLRDSVVVLRITKEGQRRWASPRLETSIIDVRIVAASTSATAGGGQRRSVEGAVGTTNVVFRASSIAVTRDLVHYYVERTNELHSFDGQGRLIRQVILPTMPVPPRPTQGQPFVKQSLIMTSDGVGRVWLEVPRAHAEPTRDWWIVSDRGEVLAKSSMPLRSEPVWIGDGRLLMRVMDTNGVETVRSCPFAQK